MRSSEEMTPGVIRSTNDPWGTSKVTTPETSQATVSVIVENDDFFSCWLCRSYLRDVQNGTS